jgi:hypothetical protein
MKQETNKDLFSFDSLSRALEEAIEGEHIHPEKKAKMEQQGNPIMGTLPDEPTSLDYYHMLVNKSYQRCVENLCRELGINPEQLGEHPIEQIVQTSLGKILRKESANKEFFEELAKRVVLELPKYKPVVEAIEYGELILDAQLTTGDLSKVVKEADLQDIMDEHEIVPAQSEEGEEIENAAAEEIGDEEPEEEKEDGGIVGGEHLTKEERNEIILAMNLMGEDEIKIKAELANAMTRGTSLKAMELYKFVDQELNRVDRDLIKEYGIVSTIVLFLYYKQEPGIEGQAAGTQDSALGSAEVKDEENNGVYTIKARGVIFPFLVHEIVKGIEKWNNYIKELRNAEKHQTIEGETDTFMYSPELVTMLNTAIPQDFQDYHLEVQRNLLKQPVDDLKEAFRSQQTLNALVREILKDILIKDVLKMTPEHLENSKRQIWQKLNHLTNEQLKGILEGNHDPLVAIYDELNPQQNSWDSGDNNFGEEDEEGAY